MRKLIFPLSAVIIAALIWSFTKTNDAVAVGDAGLSIGDKMPMADEKFIGIDDKSTSLSALKGKNGLLVIFSCNTCPFVIQWEETYPKLSASAKELGIGMALLNSNEQYRKEEDSLEEMKKHAKEKNYGNIPYLIDKNHKVADAFGASTTPHVFLFDKDMKLVYRGLIDDRFESRERTINRTYLSDAMQNMAAGKTIEPAITKEKGCSIKRLKS